MGSLMDSFKSVPEGFDPKRNPAVSVIIPAYGVSQFIAETLDSVFAQTFSDFEVILVNDGSPDTPELEKALEPYLHRIVYIRQERRGVAAARNTALREAKGLYVAFLDGDDLWTPDALAVQLEFLNLTPELDGVWGDAFLFGDPLLEGRRQMDLSPSAPPVTLESLLGEQCVPITSCVVCRTQAVLDAGLFVEGITFGQDFDLWVRMVRGGKRFGFHRKIVGRRRIHPGSATAKKLAYIEYLIRNLERLRADQTLPREARDIIDRQLAVKHAAYCLEQAKQCLDERRYSESEQLFAKSHSLSPNRKLKLLLFGLRVWPGATRLFSRWWSAYVLKRRPFGKVLWQTGAVLL
jgi:glycosyltransferase involved in cell wall biosynthesis